MVVRRALRPATAVGPVGCRGLPPCVVAAEWGRTGPQAHGAAAGSGGRACLGASRHNGGRAQQSRSMGAAASRCRGAAAAGLMEVGEGVEAAAPGGCATVAGRSGAQV